MAKKIKWLAAIGGGIVLSFPLRKLGEMLRDIIPENNWSWFIKFIPVIVFVLISIVFYERDSKKEA